MRRNGGFTLIEIILTLAVLASVSILVLPALFGRSHQEQRLTESSQTIADVFRTARQRAIDLGTPVCVGIVNGTGNYRCWVMRDTSVAHIDALPAGVTLHALRKNSQGQELLEVVFREDGNATPNEFEIRGPGASKRIVIQRLAGQVTVEEFDK